MELIKQCASFFADWGIPIIGTSAIAILAVFSGYPIIFLPIFLVWVAFFTLGPRNL